MMSGCPNLSLVPTRADLSLECLDLLGKPGDRNGK